MEERNKRLARDYQNGMTLKEISVESGLSKTQLSRIFRSLGAKRPKYELDKEYFDCNNKTTRQISKETGLSIKRVNHLKRIAYGSKLTRGKTNFTDQEPIVDPDLINDKDWLYEQYIIKQLGAPTIAKMLATKCSFVYKAFKEFGIKQRTIKQNMQNKRKWPSKEWLQEKYIDKKWSVEKCAKEFGTGWNSIYEAAESYQIPLRNASQQHIGKLNEFYGKKHDQETKEKCTKIGTRCGSMYWEVGDVSLKKEIAREKSKEIWSNPQMRSESSKRISELCKQGKCNSKNQIFVSSNGENINMKSSWELITAKILDGSNLIEDWKYEEISIEYCDGEIIRNFVVDFWVKWIDGIETLIECKNQRLLAEEKEQIKIATAKEYCDRHGYGFILIDTKEQIKKLLLGYKDMVEWINTSRYKVSRKYLDEPKLFIDMMLHGIVSKICPWKPLQYTNKELEKDILRIKNENLNGYEQKDGIHSTAPNSGGMPGRILMTHFNPHFWDVAPKSAEPLPKAFEDKKTIYKCLNISYSENESLSTERLLREINFHCGNFGRTSHFAPGFARIIIRLMNASGKKIFDPCCGWGGRLLGAWSENCEYMGCDISPNTYGGLKSIMDFTGFYCEIHNKSCLDVEWPENDLIFTSPPFYDVEHYIGGDQPWQRCKSRKEWIDTFVVPFIDKINSRCILYLDAKTRDDYENVKKFSSIIDIKNKRHARRKVENEFLCIY